ncbi:hypothetical protein RclHR1_01180004 [Rhizophagus clarus]|uniref:Galactose oxidase n=1 Tax=Rhizophagus clarus TaxID=94130 RepID=A0A2Z6Q5C5_9GLOM|nr:hypothetical protein RclHR1_01180004 [Rhizophagus clarus]GES79561.1 hypothetical protein GLOIN_2v1641931 [Rhizophagus clarus]
MLFLCLIVICLYLNEFTLAFTPNNTVWGLSAVFVNSRIYITGGLYPQNPFSFDGAIHSNEFYYLDVEKPFGVGAGDTLPWVNLSSQILPTHAWSAFCGFDDSLILYIGEYDVATANVANSVYTYGISSQQWSNPTTTNPPQFNFHSQSQTVCDVKTGKMYRFGGLTFLPSGQLKINYNMDIFDTSTLVWKTGNPINAPKGRFDHTGTLLPNGYIVYIGGNLPNNEGLADMSELPLYNTNDDTWTSMNVPGYSPTHRAYHSAVLTQDGRIIVYGGYTGNDAVIDAADDLVILDTSQPIYTWSRANVSTNSNPPPPRFYHTATLVGDYMIVVFGRNDISLPPPTSNEVFILDTSDKSNYKWVSEFGPNPEPLTPSTAPDSSNDLNKNLST